MRAVLATLLLLFASACGSTTPNSPADATATATSSFPTASEHSALEGKWDTGPYPSSRVRAAIVDAGFSSADADEPSGGGQRFEFSLYFYQEGGVPFVAAGGWDPDNKPEPDYDHGPYRLLPNHRIAITCDVCDVDTQFMLFSYHLSGNKLNMHFIRSVDPERTAKELHDDAPFLIAWTAAPFHRTG
jgi:hypothetical protein